MRHKRAKQNRRTLQYFERIAGFHPPYFVLLDGPFVVTMIKFKLDLATRLEALLSHSEVRLCVLSSTVQELEKLNAADTTTTITTTTQLVRTAIHWCNTKGNCTILQSTTTKTSTEGIHQQNPEDVNQKKRNKNNVQVLPETIENLSDAARQLFDYVKNDPRYFVASQDVDLLSSLRQNRDIPVPIIRLSRTVLLLESPNYHHHHPSDSGGSKQDIRKSQLTLAEQELVDLVKRQNQSQTTETSLLQRRQQSQKAKGPNPLSCKSKKRKIDSTNPTTVKKKRTRKKKSALAQSDASNDADE